MYDIVEVAENERENMLNVRVVLEIVYIAKIECEALHNCHYTEYNVNLLY